MHWGERVNRPKAALNPVINKLTKLGDAIAISKSETINYSLTDPLTGVTARRCYRIYLKDAIASRTFDYP